MKRKIMLASAMLIAAGCNSNQPQQTAQTDPVQHNTQAQYQNDFTGPRGPDGPAGARGAQGAQGETGAAGLAVAGPRGAAGPTGATGERGRTGAQGPAGDLAMGPAGVAGPAGGAGEQGRIGQTGVQGSSAEGYAGPAGPAGLTGAQGPTGETGAKGPTLVGPAGPAGRAGVSGEQGERGEVGGQGSTTAGVAGAAGVAGDTGEQGTIGSTGMQGQTGVVQSWTPYRDFWFDDNMAVVHYGDADKLARIAAYMKANPSLQLAIDGSTNPRTTDARVQNLNDSRVKAVRDALVQAGVPTNRITTGMFGNVDLRRDGRVELLIKTDQQLSLAQAQAQINPVVANNGVVERWTTYQDFWFDANGASVHPGDTNKINEIAAYMKQNPSMQLGIDSSAVTTSTEHLNIAKRRGTAIRDALIAAGVPASSIKVGTFGNADLRRDGRVEVLIITDRFAQSQ